MPIMQKPRTHFAENSKQIDQEMFGLYTRSMAMGTRKKRQRQEALWYGGELPTAPGHPFYKRLNEVLDGADFDLFCESSCASFYLPQLRTSVSASGPVFP